MRNILITGGLGFIGTNLASFLDRSEYNVVLLDNLSASSPYNTDSLSGFKRVQIDVRDETSLTKAFYDIDVVVHLAASGNVVDSVHDPRTNFSTNVIGTLSVLNAARENKVGRVIFASTGGAIMGNTHPPVSELSLPAPVSPYGASKLAGEAYCQAFSKSYGIEVVALRFANVYGPFSWHKKGAVTNFIKSAITGKPLVIFGDGTSTRDYLYVEDLCRGIEKAINYKLSGFELFHLATGMEVNVTDLAEFVCEIAGVTQQNILFKDSRVGEIERNFANPEKAKVQLGFVPKVSLKEGLQRTVEWFKQVKTCSYSFHEH
jgi:UDP-glucose 4-epimerase